MKSYNYVLLFAVFSVSIFLISVSLTFDANTGNEKFDERLNEINKDALADISAFKAAIVEKYHVDEMEIASLISTMEPAEIPRRESAICASRMFWTGFPANTLAGTAFVLVKTCGAIG